MTTRFPAITKKLRYPADKSLPLRTAFYLIFSFNRAGKICDVAYASKKETADQNTMLTSACKILSAALDAGATLDSILDELPEDGCLTYIVGEVAKVQKELAP